MDHSTAAMSLLALPENGGPSILLQVLDILDQMVKQSPL